MNMQAHDFVHSPQPRREWTTKEQAYLRAHYVADGADAVATALGRSLAGVYDHARKLGLHRPRVDGSGPFKPKWTTSEQIDAVIRRVYTSDVSRGMVDRAAAACGRPRWWVSKRATMLGLTAPRFKEPAWTSEEEAILHAMGSKTPQAIRLALRRHGFTRSDNAISVRMKRLRVDRTDDNVFGCSELGEGFGVHSSTIVNWITKGYLKASRKGTARTDAQNGDMWAIKRDDVRQFVLENVALIDIRKVEKHWFVDLVANR